MALLGLRARHVSDPSQLITSLAHTQLLVVRVDHDTAMLEECLTLAQMPGRRVPVVCRVPPQQIDLAVQAARLGADHVISTQEWSEAVWAPVIGRGAMAPAATGGVDAPMRAGFGPGVDSVSASASAPAPRAEMNQAAASAARRSVVFVDPASQQLLALARKVAQTEVSALLVGPTGAGKEVLARVLHEASPRAAGPFVGLNCGALPEHLIEDLLFGHEKGAFSGAIRDHQGVFEQAQGGTVFLDEIGEMPLHLQTRLLRVLQERCVTRLGGSRTIAVDVRIVAATNRDLKQAMLQREFREDLYFRISTFTLRVLPLRQRPMDILPLAAHVLQQHGTPGEPYRITEEARRRLLSYAWPGNVRELGNVIQRALVLCPGRVLTEDHLLFDDDVFGANEQAEMMIDRLQSAGRIEEAANAGIHRSAQEGVADALTMQPAPMDPTIVPAAALPGGGSSDVVSATPPGLQWAVRHSELQVIRDAIRNTANREAAARLLGISPRTLRYKLAQMRDMGLLTAECAA